MSADDDQLTTGTPAQHPKERLTDARIVAAVYLVLFSVGVAVFAIADQEGTVGRIALGVTVAVAVAGLLHLTWGWAGGGPVEQELGRLKGAIEEDVARLEGALQGLRSANAVMADLATAGIERVYPERSTSWVSLRKKWCTAIESAKEIDLMGLSLYGLWFKHPELRDALERAAAKKHTTVRVLTLPLPGVKRGDAASLDQRMQQLGEEKMDHRLPGLLRSTFEALEDLPNVAKNHYVVTKSTLYSSIVRIGEYVYVAPYMASVEGDDSLAFEARGPSGKAFKLYTYEFETIWKDETTPPANRDG